LFVTKNLDLRDAARRGGNAVQMEFPQKIVVLGHRALALEDLNKDAGLVVGVSGEPNY